YVWLSFALACASGLKGQIWQSLRDRDDRVSLDSGGELASDSLRQRRDHPRLLDGRAHLHGAFDSTPSWGTPFQERERIMSSKLPCGRPMPARAEKNRQTTAAKNWREHLATYLQSKDLKQSESRNRIVEILVEE